jgi:2-methylcitrate dehydratase PrpD
MRLAAEGWGAALGIAGTQAAGLKAVFGTMCKPLHAGRAAMNGLLAARLARRGFTGRPDIVEAALGFGATHAPELVPGRLDAWDDRFLITRTLFKYHAACYLTHSTIDNVSRLRREHELDAERVRRIEIRVAPGVLDVCDIPEPRTGLEGKFSLRATAAMALLGDDTGAVAAYTDERVTRPALVEVRDRVTVVPDGDLTNAVSTAVLELADGSRLSATADSGQPCPDLAEQRRRLDEKFLALTEPVLGAAQARRLRVAAGRVDELESVAALLAEARA